MKTRTILWESSQFSSNGEKMKDKNLKDMFVLKSEHMGPKVRTFDLKSQNNRILFLLHS